MRYLLNTLHILLTLDLKGTLKITICVPNLIYTIYPLVLIDIYFAGATCARRSTRRREA